MDRSIQAKLADFAKTHPASSSPEPALMELADEPLHTPNAVGYASTHEPSIATEG